MACESIVAGIIYPKLCRSPLCRLEGKLNNLLFAVMSDFYLNIIVVVLMVVIYFAKCGPGERPKRGDLRLIKVVVVIIDVLVRVMALWFSADMNHACGNLEKTGCIAKHSETAGDLSMQNSQLTEFFFMTATHLCLPLTHIVLEYLARQFMKAKFKYKKLAELDPNDEREDDMEKYYFPPGKRFSLGFHYHVTLNLLVCFDFILIVWFLWPLFGGVMHVGRVLKSAYIQAGSDWCRYCSDGHHHGDIDKDTFTTEIIRSRSIVIVLGVLVVFSFIMFIVVIAKRLARD